MTAVELGRMQGSLNKMAPANRQWRQAADWARELAHLVDTMQAWLARQLSSTRLPFQKVCSASSQRPHCSPEGLFWFCQKTSMPSQKVCSGSLERLHCPSRRSVLALLKGFTALPEGLFWLSLKYITVLPEGLFWF